MSLSLEFSASGPVPPEEPLVEAAGFGEFRLYAGRGQYLLPDVVLHTAPGVPRVRLLSVAPTQVLGVTGELQQLLMHSWVANTRPAQEVFGRLDVVRNHTIPESVVRDCIDFGRRRDGHDLVRVIWMLEYLDTNGVEAPPDTMEVFFDFVKPGTQRPAAAEAGTGDDPVRTMKPIRHRSSEPELAGFAAIDLGTSSSTVSLYDVGDQQSHDMDPAQERMLADRLAVLVADTTLPDDLAQEWKAAISRLDQDVKADGRLAERLKGVAESHFVHEVCRGIEEILRDSPPELAEWLAPKLHSCYQTAFSAPPMRTYRLEPHAFDPDGKLDIDSSVSVVSLTGPRLYLGKQPPLHHDQLQDADKPVRIRDLKRRFARSGGRPDRLKELNRMGEQSGSPAGGRIERVVAAVYDFLADSVEHEHMNRDDETPRLTHVVATYPTTTTPTARRKLRELLQIGLDLHDVTTSYDEGVAAGLYFLMRDLGQNYGIGLEMFRARARQLSTEPPTWEQAVVVIDIGGGTTDIAVIKYTMIDVTARTPIGVGVPDDVIGRFYEICPEVVGSTGHALLGGHYLTLRVFYWLKAAIIDAIVVQGGDDVDNYRAKVGEQIRGKLADYVLDHTSGAKVVPDDVADRIRVLLPTTFQKHDPSADQSGFNTFWQKAEEVKITLGAWDPNGPNGTAEPKTFTIQPDEVRDLLNAIPRSHRGEASDIAGLWANGELVIKKDVTVMLTSADFVLLTEPAVRIAAGHAADLVGKVIDNGRATALDRILLSGQSSLMPLVEGVVADALATNRTGAAFGTSSLETEQDYAKQAASLGACWAQHNVSFAPPQRNDAAVTSGRTELAIRGENLHGALPCDFVQGRFGRYEELFSLGEPYRELDASGHLGVRTKGFEPLRQAHEIRRVFGAQHTSLWSYFTIKTYADRRGQKYDDQVWGPGGTMQVMVELNQACEPTLHLCNNGEVHYVAPAQPRSFRDALPNLFDDGLLRALPTIVVSTGSGNHADPIRRTCPLKESSKLDDVTELFDIKVRTADDPNSNSVPGHVLLGLPRLSGRSGEYTFTVSSEPDSVPLAPIPVPGGASGQYKALLTRDGQLWVFRGELAFLTANNLTELETVPGAVLSVEPGTDKTEDDPPGWDPFSGEH